MFKESYLPPWLLIYGLCIPLALALGYLLATPLAFTSYAVVGLILVGLAFPILLRWHHALLIFSWNAYLIVYFLPGQPNLGITLAVVSLLLSLLHRTVRSTKTFIHVPSVAWSLIFIGAIAGVTAIFTGGIGGRALGTESWGAKRYVSVFGGILGYFAIVANAVPKEKAIRYASLFLVSGVTAAVSDLIYLGGPRFYLFYSFFSMDPVVIQVLSQESLVRLSGIAFAAQSASFFMLLRYGIRGIFGITRPWRLIFFSVFFSLSLFGGYRSTLILGLLIFLCQFWFERLYRGGPLVVLLIVGLLLGCGIVAFSNKLPLSVQRTLTFLPLDLDSTARRDAEGTLEWRFQMWKIIVPEIPRYLLLGKGFTYSGTDFFLTQEAMRRGMFQSYESTLISGNYHQGLLTLIIPFGIWGVIGFAWFCFASVRALYSNYRFGESSLKQVNTCLLSLFVARLIFYVIFYGQFDLDLPVFVGFVALSISLNGGVRCKEDLEIRQTVEAGRLGSVGGGVG
jgi:hypothetical protein